MIEDLEKLLKEMKECREQEDSFKNTRSYKEFEKQQAEAKKIFEENKTELKAKANILMEDATAMIMATNVGVNICGNSADIMTILVMLLHSIKENDNGINPETLRIACELGLADGEEEQIDIIAKKMETLRRDSSKLEELSRKIDELFGDE